MSYSLRYSKILSVLLVGFFVFSRLQVAAQQFDFNSNCRQAYNAILSLKLEEGKKILQLEARQNSDNLIVPYLENYADFLTAYATDTRYVYENLKRNKEVRLVNISSGDIASPYYLYTQAEINLQWAALSIKFGDYMNAIFEIRKAFKLLEENQQKFPDFKPNEKSLGVLYALIGSVPDKYKWGINLLGMEGSVSKGLNMLERLVNYCKKNDFIFRDETVIYYSLLLFQLQNEKDKAWTVLQENGFPKSDNLLTAYACAHIGIYGKHNDDALKILEQLKPNDAFLPFPHLNYLAGLAKLHRLEYDADTYFKQFLVMNKGDNHIKSSYQKIAWTYLLRGDTINYSHFMNKAENLGASMLEADKQAQREAESNRIPDKQLLQARLLFDGNYFQRAADLLHTIDQKNLKTIEDQTEYLYRLGRVYDDWNKKDSALIYYQKTIDKGKDIPRYFAANAAYESGKLMEQRNEIEKAKAFYYKCISFEQHEYKNGLDQKAKAALNRLK